MIAHFKDNTNWEKACNFWGNSIPFKEEEIEFLNKELAEYKARPLKQKASQSFIRLTTYFTCNPTKEIKASPNTVGLTSISRFDIVFYSNNLKLIDGDFSHDKVDKQEVNRHCFSCYVYTDAKEHRYRKHYKNDETFYSRFSHYDLEELINKVKNFINSYI